MWNCSIMLTRNGSLCNSTVNFTTKESYLKNYVASISRKKLLSTNTVSIKKHSNLNISQKCYLTRALLTIPHHTYEYTKSIPNLSNRSFHTCLTQRTAADSNKTSPVSSSNTHKLKSQTNCEDLLEENDIKNIEYDPFDDTSTAHTVENLRSIGDSAKPVKKSKDISRIYPNPKGTLHNIYQTVKSSGIENPITFTYSNRGNSKWECTIDLTWPKKSSFSACSSNKISSSNAASLKCLHWLESLGRLKKGAPIIFTSNELKEILNRPVRVELKSETLNAAKEILDEYEENIKSIIETHNNTLYTENYQKKTEFINDPVGRYNPLAQSEEKRKERNERLRKRYESRMNSRNEFNMSLPILQFRQQIIDAIEKNNVLVIKGDTGCGKTTQVPQYIMDSFAERGCATDCNMIVAEPRRISAISLAERIANERREQVSDVVGFQVRLSQNLPMTPGAILLCTNGILLRKMQFNPTLEGCSHVIIDEAHERTINTDMLLVLLKRAIEKRPDLKLIIMSATINAGLFQNFFNCDVIEVPGRTFPVQMNFLEDINQLDLVPSNQWNSSPINSETEKPGLTIDIPKIGALISYICEKKPPGSILCFLPGWSEISKMKKYLEEYAFLNQDQILIVPIHSRMQPKDQQKIFAKPPSNIRKIVLATDIAETGITVTDVVYVIDSCTKRQVQLHDERGFSHIETKWASQANINQRKGRAGRVKPGESYHFITRQQYERLPIYPEPEIKCLSLEKTVLNAKTYSNEKALDFLGSMPEPPSINTTRQAIKNLEDLGALDYEENLTPLGRRISLFALTPQLSKSLIYASIFQCLSPILTITSLMSEESDIFNDTFRNKASVREIKSNYHPSSDHISIAWLFQQWKSLNTAHFADAREFTYENKIVDNKIYILSKVRELNAEYLYNAQMLSDETCYDDLKAKENEYAELDELCRGVLLSGLDQILQKRNSVFKKAGDTLITEDKCYAILTPESVNFKRKYWPSPFLTYVHRTHNTERKISLIRESSIISPLTVFLFAQAKISAHVQDNDKVSNTKNIIEADHNDDNNNRHNDNCEILFTVKNKQNVRLICKEETADVLFNFRETMWAVVHYLVANYGVVSANNQIEFEQVEVFKMKLLQVLCKMLSEAAKSIDDPTPQKK